MAYKSFLNIKWPIKSTAKITGILGVIAIFLLTLPSTIVCNRYPDKPLNMADANLFYKGLENFGTRLFSELIKSHRQKNIVFSPFSIQTCLAMARMGAEGKTALAIDQGLFLTVQNPEELADKYHAALAQYVKSPILKIANILYVMQGYEVRETFNELLTKKFHSSVKAVDFAHNIEAAQTINTWVEEKTNNLIKNLIAPQMLDANTRLVLVNAIHFKGEWLYQFPERSTREMDFYLDEIKTVKVQMMHIKHNFRYGEFPELDATVLEMPYKDSDLVMLIILPNKRSGLPELEEKLKNVSLADLSNRMYSIKVIVDMPKFTAEFEVELTDPLINLGMSRMFSGDAEFGKMLKSHEPFRVSKVVHKAFIEVNEKGTEAAAATAVGIMLCSMPMFEDLPKHFNANKPFFYVLLNNDGLVIFEGRVQHF